ncbi:hypothetical protein EXIGLDRAFT_721111 [Exidia glandulosa HHB12029]|uniref:F-box domain-containing protein n=1 Tax=Exidia glandulosa HHB12029 TaxID=1314781 RepID=A0A165FXK0_EXIGL|nr:hypothetical protein EXIGLDRAFT_721111 [Exidia glandulosa HHB12029]
MQRHATFADLPVELAERIVLIIAHCWTLEDKPSLANLARVSRAIHTLVQPILVRYVDMTDSNVSKIRAVAHLFRSTRALTVQHPGLKRSAWQDFYLSVATFPALDLYVGPTTALYALLRYSNPERIVTRTVVHLQNVFLRIRLDLNVFSHLTHLRVASPLVSHICMQPEEWASFRVTHLMVDLNYSEYDGPVEVQHMFVPTALASLLAPACLTRLERLCVLSII